MPPFTFINTGNGLEFFIHLVGIIIGLFSLIYFLKIDKKRYGLLFLLAAAAGIILCYIFVGLKFYYFPYLMFPAIEVMPITVITLSFPIVVLFAVRFSPKPWAWKIPFYWGLIHLGMLFETWALNHTILIEYNFKWDTWDSYTWWWIYFLSFEWVGGLIIPAHLRRPLHIRHFHYGRLGWAILHFILVVTIFLAGYYLGSLQ